MIASPSMSMSSGAWKSITSQTGVTNLQPTELVDNRCLQSCNQKYVSQIDISQLTTHIEAILTDFRFYTNYSDIHISEYFYLSYFLLILNPIHSLPTINQTTKIVYAVCYSQPDIHFRSIETLLITLYPNASAQFRYILH